VKDWVLPVVAGVTLAAIYAVLITLHEVMASRDVERLTRAAHLVGAVPNFDADVLDRRMREHGILPSWHYHLVDVETLAVGWLARRSDRGRVNDIPTLPWDSEAVSRALNVEPPADNERHTAMGDAKWVRAMYDSIMGLTSG
jgi:hypothetical protein